MTRRLMRFAGLAVATLATACQPAREYGAAAAGEQEEVMATGQGPTYVYLPQDYYAELTREPGTSLEFTAPVVAAAVGALRCAQVPTEDEVKTAKFEFENSFLSHDEALRASIPLAGVSGGATARTMVMVVDYRRARACDTDDPEVELLYGHSVRASITLTDFDAQFGMSFAALAAGGTIRNKSQIITVTTEGVASPKLDSLIALVNGKNLNVENYAAFQQFHAGLPLIPSDPHTTISVELLGRREKPKLRTALATSFALYSLSRGRSCSQTKASLPQNLSDQTDAVEEVYKAVMDVCSESSPDDEFKARARKILGPLKVER